MPMTADLSDESLLLQTARDAATVNRLLATQL